MDVVSKIDVKIQLKLNYFAIIEDLMRTADVLIGGRFVAYMFKGFEELSENLSWSYLLEII